MAPPRRRWRLITQARIAWHNGTAGQNYEETAEFVESIPFNETRDYVQIVSRNAELYRHIYGRAQAAASQPSTDRGR